MWVRAVNLKHSVIYGIVNRLRINLNPRCLHRKVKQDSPYVKRGLKRVRSSSVEQEDHKFGPREAESITIDQVVYDRNCPVELVFHKRKKRKETIQSPPMNDV